VHDTDDTDIVGVQIGKPFAERVKGWPLDFVGYVGLIRHLDKGLQDDSWELDIFMKAFFYGFPWDEQVRTRLGFGLGLSVVERIPYTEQADADANGEATSKLLNYIDLTVDFSVGDALRSKKLANTFLGLGVSHRSGLFGSAQIFGYSQSGSNYFYLYLETKL
jgi:outer membrane protein